MTYNGKLGRYAEHYPRDEKRPQWFDLLADPHETQNVAADHPEVVAQLAEKIETWWLVTECNVQTNFMAKATQK